VQPISSKLDSLTELPLKHDCLLVVEIGSFLEALEVIARTKESSSTVRASIISNRHTHAVAR
jgi:hypothetical protein